MARKRPIEDTPLAAVSSSEEESESASGSEVEESETEGEEEEENDTVKTNQNGVVQQDNKDEEEEEEEEAEEEEVKSPVHKSTATKIATPSNSDSHSDSDSESTQPSPSPSAFTIKPIIKPNPMPTTPTKPDPKKNKKQSPTNGADDDDSKKTTGCIQRLWSEEDETAILNGMCEYQSEKGSDPSSHMRGFYEFIKKAIHVDVSKNQLSEKIRRLKKKYQNNFKKYGAQAVFSNPHEVKSFELSKKIWGSKGNDNNKKPGAVAAKGVGVTLGLAKQGVELSVNKKRKLVGDVKNKGSDVEMEEDREKENYLFLSESVDMMGGVSDGAKKILREKLLLGKEEKVRELDGKWRKWKKAELELFVKRMELVKEQVEFVLDAVKSADS